MPSPKNPPRANPSPRWLLAVPPLLAVVLSFPSLRYGYFWDDYLFLTLRGVGDPTAFLLPHAGESFYRPVSQGLYFLFLRAIAFDRPLIAHVLNLALFAGAVSLLTLVVRRWAGMRTGLMAGLLFASFGLAPGLVAWVSCDQDLLALVFVLAALLFRQAGRKVASLACGALALFSKEPGIVVFPILLLWDRFHSKHPKGWTPDRATAIGTLATLATWLIVHPGLHSLLLRGFASGATGYVGFDDAGRGLRYLGRYLLTFANIAPPDFNGTWRLEWLPWAAAGLALVAVAFLALKGPHEKDATHGHAADADRLLTSVGSWIAVPPTLMVAFLIEHWAPYFAYIASAGVAMAVAPSLARWRTAVAAVTLAAFLVLGIRYRGADPGEQVAWTERVFEDAAWAIHLVEHRFERVLPTIPRGAQVIVSAGASWTRGIHGTLLDNQALQVWYGDPTLRTVTTLGRRPGFEHEVLVRITSDLDIIEIDPWTHEVHATSNRPPELLEIDRAVRAYSRAVAAGGDTDGAIAILASLEPALPVPIRPYNKRMIAMMMDAAGRRPAADSVLAVAGHIERGERLRLLVRLVQEASSSERLDDASFRALEFSREDPEVLRTIVEFLRAEKSLAQAAWWSARLRRIVPDDRLAADVIREAASRRITPSRAPDLDRQAKLFARYR